MNIEDASTLRVLRVAFGYFVQYLVCNTAEAPIAVLFEAVPHYTASIFRYPECTHISQPDIEGKERSFRSILVARKDKFSPPRPVEDAPGPMPYLSRDTALQANKGTYG